MSCHIYVKLGIYVKLVVNVRLNGRENEEVMKNLCYLSYVTFIPYKLFYRNFPKMQDLIFYIGLLFGKG